MDLEDNLGRPVAAAAKCPAGSCELCSLTASQFGSLLGLLAAFVLLLVGLLKKTQDGEGDSSVQFWVIFGLTALYYGFSEWTIETCNYQELRSLTWVAQAPFWLRPLRWFGSPKWLEWWIRVIIIVLFGITAAGVPEVIRFGLSQMHAQYAAMIVIYGVFLLWDLVLVEGGATKLAWSFFWPDFIGYCLMVGYYCLHHIWNTTAVVDLSLLAVLVGSEIRGAVAAHIRKLGARHELR
jgi:hypothetical protein